MKKLRSFFTQSELINIGSINSASLLLKLVTAFLTSKLTALFLGVTGVSILGNWRNTAEVIQKLSTGSLQNGVVKYAASAQHSTMQTRELQSTLFYVGCFLSVTVMIFTLFLASFISEYVFRTPNYASIIRLLGILLPLYVLNIYLQSILKAYQAFKLVVKLHSIGHVFNLLVFSICIYLFGLEGALISVAVVPSLMGVFSFYIAYQSSIILYPPKRSQFKLFFLKGFRDYALMSLLSTLIFPFTYLSIRNLLSRELSLEASGYWEAMFRISTLYISFAISLINLVVLPKLASASSQYEFKRIVFQFYKQVLPFFIGGLVIVYVLKSFIVKLVFTEDFTPTTDLFLWQQVGDLFRVLALVMVAQFHAKKMLWHYIITDLVLAALLYLTTFLLLDRFGLKAAVIGHAITYITYFLIILIIFKDALSAKTPHEAI